MQLVEIYFDTATFDDIERDKKVKTEAQLSLIGGTMGLLTGFSIISGVEIVYFLLRLISLNLSWHSLNMIMAFLDALASLKTMLDINSFIHVFKISRL